jgi:signal peptidase II
MKTRRYFELGGYGLVFGLAFLVDRLTKSWILAHLEAPRQINEWLSFHFVLNRGISWGLFYSEHEGTLLLIATAVIGLMIFLASFARDRWQRDHVVLGEVLALAGALSNLVDRFLYRGVVDFIVLSYEGLTFPAFNIADACIVTGIMLMLVSVYVRGE